MTLMERTAYYNFNSIKRLALKIWKQVPETMKCCNSFKKIKKTRKNNLANCPQFTLRF